ncbi:MAG: hypothetical protein IJY39_03090 [Clostridia bacterium]|nr:hypothetical protein [Clostridia bacterium]
MKRTIKLLSLLLALCLVAGAAVSCSSQGKTLMSLEDKTLSVNFYELLLSRMKGTLYSYGYEVDKDSFWKTIITADGMTYDDYFCITIMEEASRYLIADYLFDANGLTVTEELEADVDKVMDSLVKAAGSKTALNSELKTYGVNYDMLRDVYMLELKISLLKDHLYGKEGEKISSEAKESYLQENYVAFSQIFLASYYYLTDLDEFGDAVYYTDDKHTAIAYDKVNGKTALDEFGREITDILGDPVYYNEEGRIAYDKVNGVIGYVKDDEGNILVEYYDDETLGEMFERAQGYANACNGDFDKFMEYVSLYDESESEGEVTYLFASTGYYGAQSEAVAYLDEIAAGLLEMETGECRAAQSDFGFHVFIRHETEQGAYANEAYKDTFSDFSDNLIEKLFSEECAKHETAVVIDQETAEDAPTMASVAINILY